MTERRKRWAAFGAGLILAASIAFPAGRATAAECLEVIEVVIPDCPEGEMLYIASEDPLELACKPIPECRCDPPRLKRVKPGARESAQGGIKHPPDLSIGIWEDGAVTALTWNRWSEVVRPWVGAVYNDPGPREALLSTGSLLNTETVRVVPPGGWSALVGFTMRLGD